MASWKLILVLLVVLMPLLEAATLFYCWDEDLQGLQTYILKAPVQQQEIVKSGLSVQAWADQRWCNKCDEQTGICELDYCIPRERPVPVTVIQRGGKFCATSGEFFDGAGEWKKILKKPTGDKKEL